MTIPIKATRCPHCTTRAGSGSARLASRLVRVAAARCAAACKARCGCFARRRPSVPAAQGENAGIIQQRSCCTKAGKFQPQARAVAHDRRRMMMADDLDPVRFAQPRNGRDENEIRPSAHESHNSIVPSQIGDRDCRRCTITSQRSRNRSSKLRTASIAPSRSWTRSPSDDQLLAADNRPAIPTIAPRLTAIPHNGTSRPAARWLNS